jgi:hypothetical protein
MTEIDLKKEERTAYRSVADTGLWDIVIASVVAMFALAPLLSVKLGDFWSSAVFLPVWAAVYIGVRCLKARVVAPRVGQVQWSESRQSRLKRMGLIMLVANLIAFALGIIAFFLADQGESSMWVYPYAFSLMLLIAFSLVAQATSIPRFFFYGILLAAAPLVGEWLFREGLASHHGFPVTFGLSAGIIALIGILRIIRIAIVPIPTETNSNGGVSND